MQELEYHPAAALLPMMEREQFSKLVEDIKTNGLLEPIALFEGQVIDGRNRFEACKKAEVSPRFESISCQSPTVYVISRNLHRRHLSPSQRAAVAAEMIPLLLAEKSRKRLASKINVAETKGILTPKPIGVRAYDVAAKTMQVASGAVARAALIKKERPDLLEQVKAGDITVWGAHAIIKKDQAVESSRTQYDISSVGRKQRARLRLLLPMWIGKSCPNAQHHHAHEQELKQKTGDYYRRGNGQGVEE